MANRMHIYIPFSNLIFQSDYYAPSEQAQLHVMERKRLSALMQLSAEVTTLTCVVNRGCCESKAEVEAELVELLTQRLRMQPQSFGKFVIYLGFTG